MRGQKYTDRSLVLAYMELVLLRESGNYITKEHIGLYFGARRL
jgi:hypothetical protein